MTIQEALNTENKKKFLELIKKYHPDTNGGKNTIIAQKLIDARSSDELFDRFLKEIGEKSVSIPKPISKLGKNLNDVLSKIRSMWISDPEFTKMINKYSAICKVEKGKHEEHPILVTIIAIKGKNKLHETYNVSSEIGRNEFEDLVREVLEYWWNKQK